MNRALLPLALTLLASAAFTTQSLSAQSSGPYNAAQAAAGAALYTAQCSTCHGVKLEGGEGPPLSGDAFLSNWGGKTASDLNDFISSLMPQTAPGSLTPAQYLSAIAYILQQNKYPAGSAPLTAAKLASVKLVKQK